MENETPRPTQPPSPTARRWPSNLLLILLLTGLAVAAVRAVKSPTTDRERTLILVAPAQGTVLLHGADDPTSSIDGTHTFTVMPGPYTMEVRMPETPPISAEIEVPRGIGGLMMVVEINRDRTLKLGYF